MAEITAKKYRIEQLINSNGDLQILHPETDADIVKVEKGTGKYEGTAANVQDALEEIYGMASTAGVTGVKGNAESTYRTGNVNLTPANIGAEAAFTDGSATIASKSGEVVTIKTGVSQTSGAIGNSTGTDITLGSAAVKSYTTSVTQNSTDLVTSGAVYAAIDNLPEPMVFKGSVGTGGTVETLPTASTANEGFVYKVITAGTYASQAAKVGDTFISTGSEWVLIPSGDEPSGTVTSVGVDTASGSHLSATGSPITSSGTITISVDSGYAIPTTDQANSWTAKQNAITSTNKLSADLVEDGTTNHVFTAEDDTKLSGIASGAQVNVIENVKLNGSVVTVDTTNKLVDLGSLVTANNAIAPGTYSVVSYDAKGLVTAGGNVLEVGATSQSTPSDTLVVGGIFFKEI